MYFDVHRGTTNSNDMKHVFFLAALALLLLSATSVVAALVEWRGVAHLMMWVVFAFASYGMVQLALSEMDDDEECE